MLVRGQGVAASCCIQLLTAAGFSVGVEEQERRGVPALMVGEQAQALIKDVFSLDPFEECPGIVRRVVAWGSSEVVTLPHRAAVISEQALVAQLHRGASADVREPVWNILAAPAGTPRGFGTRMAVAAKVDLAPDADPRTCWVESLESGWLFLAGGWLLSVGEGSLERSTLIRAQIAAVHPSGGEFPAYPRVADPLCGAGWLRCGTAALAFDPLCGDGTGNAVREAILASAVIRAVARGLDGEALLAHYRARLLAAFRKHLEICRGFYETGGSGAWWRQELSLIHEGIALCAQNTESSYRFRLNGWELEPVE